MQHILKYKDEKKIRPSEAAVAFCDAREKLKTAARTYANRKVTTVEALDPKRIMGTPDMTDFTDESPEGKALEEAARTYVWWRDFCEHARKKAKVSRG